MIVKAREEDANILADLAVRMWKKHSIESLTDEFLDILSKNSSAIFLKYENGISVGFAQCQLRYDYVEGTKTTPVGYLEGVFIIQEYRNKGYAKALVSECEIWARNRGCKEFGSDCEIGNVESLQFHKAINFKEVNRIICFTKKL